MTSPEAHAEAVLTAVGELGQEMTKLEPVPPATLEAYIALARKSGAPWQAFLKKLQDSALALTVQPATALATTPAALLAPVSPRHILPWLDQRG
jgi:hypothetical protein